MGKKGVGEISPEGRRQHQISTSSARDTRASTISFHDVNYHVQVTKRGKPCGSTEKHILKNINGLFKPGMNAILGPTGSGKSSFLDVLAGRKEPEGLTGHVLVDGSRQPKNFKCMTGYVVQDDVVMGTLTVRENLTFSANVRLSEKVSGSEKKERVEELVQELGLTHCIDSKVGNDFIRGVSGGERKRTNIGMELIISPPVLFLDEPTTGLDASTANAVMKLLHKLSRKGRTIIFSIHQPRYAIFKLFDRLLLLSLGDTVYHGPSQDALEYFESIGYTCEPHNNPPDFFLDVINGDSTAVTNGDPDLKRKQMSTLVSKGELVSAVVTHSLREEGEYQELSPIGVLNGGFTPSEGDVELGDRADGSWTTSSADVTSDASLVEKLRSRYQESKWNREMLAEVNPILEDYLKREDSGQSVVLAAGEYATSFWTQLNYVCRRTLLNLLRNPQTSFAQFGIVIVFALIVGLVYLQIGNVLPAAIQNRFGALFFVIMNQVFSNLSAVELFIKERAIFMHENSSGFYRVSAYFLAKVLCDILPLRTVPLLFFCAISYFMVGFQTDVGKFFFYLLALWTTTLAASSLAFLLSAVFRIFAIANIMIALCFVLMMVFGGLLVNLNTMGAWLSWLQYFSIFRYALNALSINEMKDAVFCTEYALQNGTVLSRCDDTTGNDFLDNQGIKYDTEWDKWQNVMALGLLGLGLQFFAYLRLRLMKKSK